MKTRLLAPCSDTLVFFGATGDLAYKQILPGLHENDPEGTRAFEKSWSDLLACLASKSIALNESHQAGEK